MRSQPPRRPFPRFKKKSHSSVGAWDKGSFAQQILQCTKEVGLWMDFSTILEFSWGEHRGRRCIKFFPPRNPTPSRRHIATGPIPLLNASSTALFWARDQSSTGKILSILFISYPSLCEIWKNHWRCNGLLVRQLKFLNYCILTATDLIGERRELRTPIMSPTN